MNYFIEKNILIDDLLELEIVNYNNNIISLFEELRNDSNVDKDIVLFKNIIIIIENNIYETNEYLKTIHMFEWEHTYVNNYINDLYNGIIKINIFLNNINNVDILSDLISEFNIK
jgi:hypothetical protein